MLGNDILGTGFDFDIEIYQGAGAFVCGEETALMASIEGKRGMPRAKPPFPAVKGLWMRPSVLNNVETFANVPPIILNGADWYASIGTEKSKGTKVFALSGTLNNTGLVEVPMGTPAQDHHLRNRRRHQEQPKVQGRADRRSVGRLHPQAASTCRSTYETINKIGAIMGSGGMMVMDETTCMVGHGEVLPRVHPRRVLRQVRSLPHRHQDAS